MFAEIIWNVSPEIIKIPEFLGIGPLSIRWYSLLFAFAFVAGYEILSRIFKAEKKDIKVLDNLTVYLIIATVIGARLGHCLFYSPMEYLSDPIEIIKVWHGGLASHGAAIGLFIAVLFFIRKHKEFDFYWLADRLTIIVALGAFCVRLGNFFNSEIIGSPADIPWAVVFTRIDNIPRHPGQLYEAISYLAIFIYLVFRYKKYKTDIPRGTNLGIFLILLFSARFIIEFFKETQSLWENNLTIDMGQILSIPFILLGIYFYFKSKLLIKKS